MLIAKCVSTESFAVIPDLRARFEARTNDHYNLGTMTGKLVVFFYALVNCSSPWAFLAKQQNQDLQYYVTNVSKFREALYQFEAQYKAGRIPEDVSFRLSDDTEINLRLTIAAGQIDRLYIKDERTGNWETLCLLPEQFLEKIEKDILNNPDLFDPRLVASCKLKPAFDNIEALQKSICKEKMEQARKAGKFNQNEFNPGGSDDFQILLTDPLNVHGRYFIEHAEQIAENLIHSGFYGTMHSDEANFKKYQACSLHIAVLDFISQNLNHILSGTISGNTESIAKAIRLLNLVPRKHLPDSIIDKLTLIEHRFGAINLKIHPFAN